MTSLEHLHLDHLPDDAVLTIEGWDDPLVDALGHDPRSPYAERFWLPVLGPSTICLLRHLVARLELAGRVERVCRIEVTDTARSLGLGSRTGRTGSFARTVQRAIDFEMARLHGTTLGVRRRLPPLPKRHLSRLPESARLEHEALVVTGGDRSDLDQARQRGRQLALSLVRLGEDTAATERQLGVWRFHPGLAHECALWAEQAAKAGAGTLDAATAAPRTVGAAPARSAATGR